MSTPQDSFTTKAKIVLPGYGGQATDTYNGLSSPTTTSGYTFDLSRARSFAISQSQSAAGSWGGTFQVEQNLDGNWNSLGSPISVGTTDTYFETAERGYGKLRINPASLTVSSVDTTITLTFTAFRQGSGY